MEGLRNLSRAIDRLNDWIGRSVSWLTGAMVALTAYDTIVRYGFNRGSVGLQELEWHLFAVVFLVGAGYTLKEDAHVRVDIFYARLDERRRAWINLVGVFLALVPFCLLVMWSSQQFVANSWAVGETSPDPGGLPARYALKAMIPLGFALILLQGASEAIKSALILRKSKEASHG
ncbi:MAG: TRAP transporter small permease subunit [Deferrisomatales bacterium]